MIPHFSNECMVMLNVNEQILWPKIDEKILLEENIKFIIQFNGKTRKIIISEKGTGEDLLLQKIKEDSNWSNIRPPLVALSDQQRSNLAKDLKDINFS